jgi:hypothetical protein
MGAAKHDDSIITVGSAEAHPTDAELYLPESPSFQCREIVTSIS